MITPPLGRGIFMWSPYFPGGKAGISFAASEK